MTFKDDLQDAKHMVTYIICFTFATRTPLDIRSAYSADCGLRPNQGQDALAGSSCSRRKPPPRGTEKSHQWVDRKARMRGPSVMDALSTTRGHSPLEPGREGKIGRNGCSSAGRTLFVRPYTSKSSLPAVNLPTYSDMPWHYVPVGSSTQGA